MDEKTTRMVLATAALVAVAVLAGPAGAQIPEGTGAQPVTAQSDGWQAQSRGDYVVQETRDPVSASAPFNGLGSLDAQLVPGHSWSVTLSHAGGVSPLTFYMNGSASCDSTGPLPLPAERL